MTGLAGKQIGIAAVRSAKEISILIEKKGGTPVIYPIQGKQQLNEQISAQNIHDFLAEPFDLAIFTTGIGAKTLTESAIAIGQDDLFFEKLRHTNIAVRGSKTMNWMKAHSLQASIVSEDGTMKKLLTVLAAEYADKRPQRVFIQAYDLDDDKLKKALEEKGHSVYLSRPYSYKKPDPEVVRGLEHAILQRSLDALIFTSKTQVKNLFSEEADHQRLVDAFNGNVLGVAVGKVTAHELEKQGVENVLQPESPKMGAMVVKVDRYYQ
ncbi:uroporphyrinogen-III synthase [Planococcus lenghuensis]|uniref:Uroporphyrinogen-III synthase n=1 Tax=Planococcus lenghuensis TaxID=2213202 RepID=A0A1Q2L0J4_9BACL|nr:uroporphyrinogen-III synthase [Planococcus lenghuensis]AQQ53577.1 uroporphyrinogen-III synthase [Planococcus lenghuensis]